MLIAGGARAILLQLAYPPVGRGVVDHSDFAGRPLDRLWATLAYAYAIVYGTEDDRVRAVRLVNRAHSPVRGEARGDAPAYSAYDPQLQLWVAATLYDTAVVVHEELFGPLETEQADALYAAYAELGTGSQLPRGQWPADRAAFAAYWAGMLPRLSVDADVRAVSRELMFVALPPGAARARDAPRTTRHGRAPSSIRCASAYGIRWTPRAERRFRRALSRSRAWCGRGFRDRCASGRSDAAWPGSDGVDRTGDAIRRSRA